MPIPELFESRAVRAEVIADRANQVARFSQQRQCVADVSGDSAALLAQRIDQKADRDDVGLFGNDVVGERTAEPHDVVVGNRRTYNSISLNRQRTLLVPHRPMGAE